MSRVFNANNLSNERVELIKEIQELCQREKCHTIKINNQSAVEPTLLIGPSFIRLDFKNLNLVHEPYIPSKMLFSNFSRPLTGDEIEKAVDILIQTIENNWFPSVSEKFQDCSVCLEATNYTTKCHHPLCKTCWKKIDKQNEKGQNVESSEFVLARCPICRKEQC
jgi:hypothetical protein